MTCAIMVPYLSTAGPQSFGHLSRYKKPKLRLAFMMHVSGGGELAEPIGRIQTEKMRNEYP